MAPPGYSQAISAAMSAIAKAPVAALVKAFNVCDETGLGPDKPTELFAYALESMPQLDYPYPVRTWAGVNLQLLDNSTAGKVIKVCNSLDAVNHQSETLVLAVPAVSLYARVSPRITSPLGRNAFVNLVYHCCALHLRSIPRPSNHVWGNSAAMLSYPRETQGNRSTTR